MNRVASAPSCSAFIHRVALEEVSTLGFSRQEHWSGLPFPSPIHESEKVKMKSLSRVRLLATPWTAAHQAPPSMGFSRHLAFSPGKEQAAGVWETCLAPGWPQLRSGSSVLAWRIPGMVEPGGLPSMGSQRVGWFGAFPGAFGLGRARISS